MKVTACIAETGQRVDARNNDHWQFVRTAPKPRLYCPAHAADDPRSCRVALISVENANGTRFFKVASTRKSCDHEETDKPAVPDRMRRPSGESPEHKWLKQFIVEAARKAGFNAETEVADPATPGRIADVFVGNARRPRVEVQRVDTNIALRTAANPDNVIWLVRSADHTHAQHDKWLFDYPCVRLRIRKKLPDGTTTVGYPWLEEDNDYSSYDVDAISTVLSPVTKPHLSTRTTWVGKGRNRRKRAVVYCDYFTGRDVSVPLPTFLGQVWRGERIWHPRWRPHKTGGWILESDYEAFEQWKAEERRRRLADASPVLQVNAAAPSETNDRVESQTTAPEEPDQETREEPEHDTPDEPEPDAAEPEVVEVPQYVIEPAVVRVESTPISEPRPHIGSRRSMWVRVKAWLRS